MRRDRTRHNQNARRKVSLPGLRVGVVTMRLKIFAEPAIEPCSLQEIKEHLRLDSGSFSDNLTPVQSIAPASYNITYELMTLDVAPGGAGWAVGDTLTGSVSTKACTLVTIITAKTYIVKNRTGDFTLGEIVSNGTTAADQGAANPTFSVGYTILGAYTDVLGYQAVVILDSGANAATGTVDAKIQESDDHITWTDWTGGAFTQVTTSNDSAIQKISYTGTKQYIRPVAKVLLATCEFGAQIAKYSSDTTEDAILTTLITAARQRVEAITCRALILQTWDGWLDVFPRRPFIRLPFGQIQSVTSIAYTDSAGTVTTMTVTTDYLVDSSSEPGRIVLPYAVSWPSPSSLTTVNPIAIRWICGYGATAASVPAAIRTAIKMIVADLYAERGERIVGAYNVNENKAAEILLWPFRLWDF